MKDFSSISDDEKWQAVVSCDRRYDGIFFYGVKTIGIFCKPSCKSKVPVRKNVVFLMTQKERWSVDFARVKDVVPIRQFLNLN